MFKINKIALLFLILLNAVHGSLTLAHKVKEGSPGDFVVTQQEGHMTLLLIRSLQQDKLLLEEISVPSSALDVKTIDWQTWVSKRAPGHTAWTMYEIDLTKGQLLEAFSLNRRGWLSLQEVEPLLTRLLVLPLSPLPFEDRKKIGTANDDGPDHRALWNPPLTVQGKRIKQAAFDVLEAQWKTDDSPLSGSHIELYFATSLPHFPFPFWIEVKSSHYSYKWRVIDSGAHLTSPAPNSMPKRSPIITQCEHSQDGSWTIYLESPSYFHGFHLFAIDDKKHMFPLPCTMNRMGDEVLLSVSYSDLKTILQNDTSYQWVIIPESDNPLSITSKTFFTLVERKKG